MHLFRQPFAVLIPSFRRWLLLLAGYGKKKDHQNGDRVIDHGYSLAFCKNAGRNAIQCDHDVHSMLYSGGFHTNCSWCKPACDERMYNVKHSIAYYPSPEEFKRVKTELELGDNLTEEFRQQFLEVTIYVDGTSSLLYEEHVQMDFFNLLSAVGGDLGLFLGASLLSIAELIHLTVLVCHSLLRKNEHSAKNIGV